MHSPSSISTSTICSMRICFSAASWAFSSRLNSMLASLAKANWRACFVAELVVDEIVYEDPLSTIVAGGECWLVACRNGKRLI